VPSLTNFLQSKKLRTQLLIGFGVTLFIAVISITTVSSVVTMNNLEDDTRENLDAYLETLVGESKIVLDEELADVTAWAAMPDVIEAATLASTMDPVTELWPTYEGEKWGWADDPNATPIAGERADATMNSSNDVLPEVSEYFNELTAHHSYAELFITDDRGYAIGVGSKGGTGNTGDFAQGDEGWWTTAKADGVHFSGLEFDESSGEWSMSISVDIKPKNTFLGVLKAQYTFGSLHDILDNFKLGKSGFAMVASVDPVDRGDDPETIGDLIIHPEETYVGTQTLYDIMDSSSQVDKMLLGDDYEFTGVHDGTGYYMDSIAIDFPAEWGLNWIAVTLIPESEVTDKIQEPIYYAVVVALVSVGILSVFAVVFSNLIAKRVNKLANQSEKIAGGDLSLQDADGTEASDEIGMLQVNFDAMIEQLRTVVSSTQESSGILSSTSEDLLSGAEEINASAEEVASTSQAMSNGATSQTELISEVNEDIGNTQNIVAGIIRKIQENTDVVSQIALQTNILALNAGIEASRAGDYGRGFAVVAENVRKLSDQSKDAAEQISSVAEEVSSSLAQAFERISHSMINVVSVSEETAASAEEVAAAAEEMTATIEELSSAAQELTTQAESSKKMIDIFSL
jgi:methyl-accepting chemotaxis protein